MIADTHELHREVDVPAADILIHAGDFTMFSQSLAAIEDFDQWLGALPHQHKIVVPGNHEFFLEEDPSRRSLLSNATVLINEAVTIAGLRIWGSPLTPQYGGAFGKVSPSDRSRTWSMVPEVDVLVTHGPPYGILDLSPGQIHRMGDPQLLEAVERVQPLLHIFGHLHGAAAQALVRGTRFVNCAMLGVDGGISNALVVLSDSERQRHVGVGAHRTCTTRKQ